MDPNAIAALVNLGVAGIGLYLFATGKLIAKTILDAFVTIYESRHAALLERYVEMRTDRDEWKRLALASERRIVEATPIVGTAVELAKHQLTE